MRIFLDIGSHIGETISEVAKPKYGFDRIVCFEPARSCLPALERLRAADPRISICPFGLTDRNGSLTLHKAGSLGGSVYATGGKSETIELIDAAEWFGENLDADDFVVVKTNCEGSEVDIVNRVLDADLMGLPVTFLITFDIRDFPHQRHREVELRRRLRASGLSNFCFSDDVMVGPTHERRIKHWLSRFGVDRPELSAAQVRQLYAGEFLRYSRKTGRRERAEQQIKETFGYGALPEPAKALLRWAKRTAGLSRERSA